MERATQYEFGHNDDDHSFRIYEQTAPRISFGIEG
jgi:hypothetical protein